MLRILEKIFGDSYERHMKKPMRLYTKPISEECWNLDFSFIDFIVPRLELFKKEASEIIAYDFSIIDEILVGFRLYSTKYDWEIEDIKKNMAIVKKSMKLFSEHWMEFGW